MSSKRPRRSGRIAATEAAKNFGRLVNRVSEERATYVVERSGVPVAHISPPAAPLGDFRALLHERRSPNPKYAAAVDAVISRHNTLRRRRNPWAR